MATEQRIRSAPPSAPPMLDDGRTDGATAESIGDLIKHLGDEGATLVRQEIALAKMEARQAATQLTRDTIYLAIAGSLALLGALALTAFLILILGDLVFGDNYWLSAVVVGAVFAIVGGVWAMGAARNMGKGLSADATVSTLKTDAAWAKDEARDFKREVL